MSKVVIALIDTSERIGIMACREGNKVNIMGFKDEEEALSYFSTGYNNNHARGYEASMSATLNYIQFTPSIVEFENFEELLDTLFKDVETYESESIRNISGSMHLVKIPDQEIAKKYWSEGKNPRLI